MAAQASRAVNISLTLRNWVIGCYIQEYEQHGADRAEYGKKLFTKLRLQLKSSASIKYHPRELRRCREFYIKYPQIQGTLSPESDHILPAALMKSLDSKITAVSRPVIRGSVTPKLQVPPEKLVNRLSYTHLAELVSIDDPLKRTFYEVECIRGNWSVRELRRQIGSLYFERSNLSGDSDKLAELVHSNADKTKPNLTIRDPYVFEFLGIKTHEIMRESDLEEAVLDNLYRFLLELDHGFCFEARRKRILIGDTHCFIDLVFYHRILKCHVLVELKIEPFTHESIGQLNTYVNWYRKNLMANSDNPPIGILLCTHKDHALVKYAIAGMDNNLFVSKYQLELPSKKKIQDFLENKLREVKQSQDKSTTLPQ